MYEQRIGYRVTPMVTGLLVTFAFFGSVFGRSEVCSRFGSECMALCFVQDSGITFWQSSSHGPAFHSRVHHSSACMYEGQQQLDLIVLRFLITRDFNCFSNGAWYAHPIRAPAY